MTFEAFKTSMLFCYSPDLCTFWAGECCQQHTNEPVTSTLDVSRQQSPGVPHGHRHKSAYLSVHKAKNRQGKRSGWDLFLRNINQKLPDDASKHLVWNMRVTVRGQTTTSILIYWWLFFGQSVILTKFVVCKKVVYACANDVHGQISGVTFWRVSASAAGLQSTISLSFFRTTTIYLLQKHGAAPFFFCICDPYESWNLGDVIIQQASVASFFKKHSVFKTVFNMVSFKGLLVTRLF